MAFISMNIASKKVTAPAYKHVGVLSIEMKSRLLAVQTAESCG